MKCVFASCNMPPALSSPSSRCLQSGVEGVKLQRLAHSCHVIECFNKPGPVTCIRPLTTKPPDPQTLVLLLSTLNPGLVLPLFCQCLSGLEPQGPPVLSQQCDQGAAGSSSHAAAADAASVPVGVCTRPRHQSGAPSTSCDAIETALKNHAAGFCLHLHVPNANL